MPAVRQPAAGFAAVAPTAVDDLVGVGDIRAPDAVVEPADLVGVTGAVVGVAAPLTVPLAFFLGVPFVLAGAVAFGT